MQKIPFVDYVCQQIDQGKFESASTACNYLVYGSVTSGQRADRYLEDTGFDQDAFKILVISKWFGFKREVWLNRQTGRHSSRRLTITPEQADRLFAAWKVAADIQKERNAIEDEKRNRRTEALHWFP